MHPSTIEEIKAKADLLEVIQEFHVLDKQGSSFYTKCPMCGKEGKGKGLSINKAKGICKCFSCDFGTNSPITFLMETQNMSYPEALAFLADKYQIIDIPKTSSNKKNKNKKSFCEAQLISSGLKEKDVLANIPGKTDEVIQVPTFQSGTRNDNYQLVDGDDMIIYYYDLEGKPMTYQRKNSSKLFDFYRIRWAIPDQHLDKNGNPMKYQSPAGAGTKLYIPQFIRTAYQNGAHIPILYLQEGEKKSEKACKHGIPSVGLSGINAIGQNGKLPYELQLLVKRCNIEKVVFIFDSDWKDISSKVFDGFVADQRPRNFYYAAKNFRDYFQTFTNINIYLELFIAGIKKISPDKGLDDLLANHLKNKEDDFRIDIEKAINEKDGAGQYIEVIKVSDMPDLKLKEYWMLHDSRLFAKNNIEVLKNLKEFVINRTKWRYNKGKLVLAQPLLNNEQYYEKEIKLTKGGSEIISYRFRYMYAYTFLQNRGFGRIEMANGNFKLCRIHNKVVEIVDSYKIKDFAVNFALNATEAHERVDVMDMLYRGAKMYLGPDSLSNLAFTNPVFEESGKHSQNLYFQKEFWKITANEILFSEYSELENYIWKDKINDFAASRVDPLFTITKITEELFREKKLGEELEFLKGGFTVDVSENGRKCHFAQYLWNTGDFYWQKHRNKDEDERTDEEMAETAVQFVAKMSGMGYLLHTFFDPSTPKAIIGMDGKLSEVGKSMGGSGKSIFGDAIGQVIPQVAIGAKNKKLTEDPFIFEEVTEKTDNVFLDDVRVNLDFEFLFPFITGKFLVNAKGQSKFTIPQHLTPKLYIATNHAINGEGSSYSRRQFMIPFSDYYNDKWSPRDEFNINFFTEWDYEQRNLFYNFMAECVQVYLKYGLIEPPLERLEMRRLRQSIGEDMIFWADEYFMFDETAGKFIERDNDNINKQITRKDLYADFQQSLTSKNRGWWTAKKFGQSFRQYCVFRGARFNPNKIDPQKPDEMIGGVDKSSGKEFFTLGVNYSEENNNNDFPWEN
jgi:DNA primase